MSDDPDDHGEFDGLDGLKLAHQIWHVLERTCAGSNTTLQVTWDQLRAAVLDCEDAGYIPIGTKQDERT